MPFDTVVGYTYEADVHCVDCTLERFPNPDNAIDNEGNRVHAFFPGDEFDYQATCCECSVVIEEVRVIDPDDLLACFA